MKRRRFIGTIIALVIVSIGSLTAQSYDQYRINQLPGVSAQSSDVSPREGSYGYRLVEPVTVQDTRRAIEVQTDPVRYNVLTPGRTIKADPAAPDSPQNHKVSNVSDRDRGTNKSLNDRRNAYLVQSERENNNADPDSRSATHANGPLDYDSPYQAYDLDSRLRPFRDYPREWKGLREAY